MKFWIQFLGVFIGMAITDYLWARYVCHVQSRNRARASTVASLLILVSAAVTVSYVADPRLILAAGAGAFAGTFVGIRE